MPERAMAAGVSDLVNALEAKYDEAWHSLVDLGCQAVPHLIAAFDLASEDKQALLVTVIHEARSAEALEFLTTALESGADAVWKAALDALVTLGGSDVERRLFRAAMRTEPPKRDWILEAYEQVRDSAPQ